MMIHNLKDYQDWLGDDRTQREAVDALMDDGMDERDAVAHLKEQWRVCRLREDVLKELCTLVNLHEELGDYVDRPRALIDLLDALKEASNALTQAVRTHQSPEFFTPTDEAVDTVVDYRVIDGQVWVDLDDHREAVWEVDGTYDELVGLEVRVDLYSVLHHRIQEVTDG